MPILAPAALALAIACGQVVPHDFSQDGSSSSNSPAGRQTPPSATDQKSAEKTDANTPLQILPPPIALARVYEYVTSTIPDEAARLETERRVRTFWESYLSDYQAVQLKEFAEAQAVFGQLDEKPPPSIDKIRGKYATALAAGDRLDQTFLRMLKELVPADAGPAIEALQRQRARSIAACGLAPHLAMSVPMKLNDPMAWLNAAEGPVPAAAHHAYDLTVTGIATGLAPVRRRFEFDMVLSAKSREQFAKILPAKAKELVAASKETANATIAAVDALGSSVTADDLARIHIARIESLYFDTPRPERRVGSEEYPSDVALRDAWFAERAKLAIADAEILKRYEQIALATMAAAPLWDTQAYNARQLLAKSFAEERTKLHDETRARLAVLNVKQ